MLAGGGAGDGPDRQDPAAADRDRLRAGQADREQVIGTLKKRVRTRPADQGRTGRPGQAGRSPHGPTQAWPRSPPTSHPGPPAAGLARPPAPARRRPLTRAAAGSGGLPCRGRRGASPLPPRSRRPPHSLFGLGCQAAVPGLCRRRRRGARHLGLRGGRLHGSSGAPAVSCRPGRGATPWTANGAAAPARIPLSSVAEPIRPAPSCALTSHGSVNGTYQPERAGHPVA